MKNEINSLSLSPSAKSMALSLSSFSIVGFALYLHNSLHNSTDLFSTAIWMGVFPTLSYTSTNAPFSNNI